MKELLTGMIVEDIKKYEDQLELLKAEKQELYSDARKVERLKKLVDKAQADGITINISEEDNDKSVKLSEVEQSIKCIKSILRRYDTICEMYEISLIEE